jgi:hypothetical protein
MVMEIIYRLAAFGFRSALKVATSGSPPQQEEGWPRHQKEAAKPHLNGADGGVVKKFLDHTTPSARTNEASRLFLIVQPPLLLLRRGVRFNHREPVLGLGLHSKPHSQFRYMCLAEGKTVASFREASSCQGVVVESGRTTLRYCFLRKSGVR